MKKLISLILTVAMLVSLVAVSGTGVQAAEYKTECGGECEHSPSIVVPGIGQSNVWLIDDNGDYVLDENGERINCFPGYFDILPLVSKVLFPLLLSLVTQQDIFLSTTLANALADCFYMNMSDKNGKQSKYVEVEKYPYSVAECSEYEKGEIYDNIPLQAYSEIAGEDHLYYFAYNSFGNNIDICNELYDFIQQVKAETGHDKVNIVPISMGGTVANGLLEYHPEVVDDLDKVLYIVPALNGSTIVGDVYTKNITFLDAEYLYNGFLEGLMDEEDARMIEVIARIIPDQLLMKCLDKAVDALLDKVFKTNTNMWALSPKEYYEEASAELLSDPDMAEIKKQTDEYHKAQVNSNKNIQNLVDNGVKVFNIVDYDCALYNIGNTWNDDNADGVIQLSSTAMGVHSAIVGETLPEDYVQANTYCSNPEHNHISPDRVVDASTGLLPDTTFYFDGQNHEKTARNDIIISLAIEILTTDTVTDVYSNPNYPQFNVARDIGKLKNHLLPVAKNVDKSALSAADAAELEAAIVQSEAVINNTAGVAGEYEAAVERLNNILIKIGVLAPETEEETSETMKNISLWLYDNFGTNGFSEYPVVLIKKVFSAVFGAFVK